MIKLTQEKCRKWIKALRSGEYRQWRGRLYGKNQHGEGYCCLGVAEKVCGLPRRSAFELKVGNNLDVNTGGLTYRAQEQLILMNDTDKASFNEIADYIEKTILPECPVR